MDKDPFKEYIRQSEPSKRDKGYAWHTAIGLQAVDGLKKIKELDDNSPKKTDSKDPKTIAKLVVDGRYSIPYMPEGIYAEIRDLVYSREPIWII